MSSRCHGFCGDVSRKLLITEVVRYIAILVPIVAGTWRFVDYAGYTEFVTSANCTPAAESGEVARDCLVQFWGVVVAIILGATVMVYVPLKVVFARTDLREARYLYGWRPSILTYIILCALPTLALVLCAIKSTSQGRLLNGLDPQSLVIIQVTVLGLTITEWMAKMREEDLSYDLLSAVAIDFFFAYDVYDFFNIQLEDGELLTSNDWVYVVFSFGLLSMFKYVPHAPPCVAHEKCCRQAAISIVTGMLCQDLPFAVIRIGTLATYGLTIADLVHPLKNVTLIVIDFWQLFVLYRNNEIRKRCSKESREEIESEPDGLIPGLIPERRVDRFWSKLRKEGLRAARADSAAMNVIRHRNVPGNGMAERGSGESQADFPDEQLENRNVFI